MAQGATPGTPKRAGTVPDADASPLPTPPRISHIYSADNASDAAAAEPPPPPTDSPTQKGVALDACVTPGPPPGSRTLRGSLTMSTGPRSVGNSLRKLRTYWR